MTGCPVCAGALRTFLQVEDAPVFCNVLYSTREDAGSSPRGAIELGFCEGCGLIRNAAFDPELVRYSPTYENSLHFSPAFQTFAEDLARRLIERYDLRGKDVVDIGCGKGDFLRLLCDGTGNRGVGYDPSYEGELAHANGAHVSFVREYYSSAHTGTPADLITCRHVLEHLESPGDLLSILEQSDSTLYFEMPDAEYMLREAAIWDVIYEHVSYFTAPALRRLFEDHGFRPIDLASSFGGQYLYVEAARGAEPTGSRHSVTRLAELVDAFGRSFDRKIDAWTERLSELRREGRRVALWGAGSKGVTFLNLVGGGEGVEHVIDVNVRKHGRFVPGTGQEVLDPESVRSVRPDVVLVMNRLYADEIRGRLSEAQVAADVLVV